MNVAAFKRIIFTAASAGLLAGLLLTAVQHVQIVPLILDAEGYEQAVEAANRTSSTHPPHASAEHNHEHGHGAWQPERGWERNLLTASANIVIALGFALLLGAAAALRNHTLNWRSGLLWGLGGYLAFFVAPSLGLPPELPGSAAADLAHRQLWWVATSAFTAAGLAFVVFSAQRALKILGVILVIAPHLAGAPQPDVHGGTAPAELVQSFIVATIIINAMFWLALGGLFGFFHQRLAD